MIIRSGVASTGVCSFAGWSDKRWGGAGAGRQRERERERLLLESLATSVVWSPFPRLRGLANDANYEEKLF